MFLWIDKKALASLPSLASATCLAHDEPMQPERPLYLAAYDISNNYRRSKAHEVLKAFSYSGQRSVFECYLTEAERRELVAELSLFIDSEDRFFLLRLDPRAKGFSLGLAIEPQDPPFFYIG